MILDRIYQFIPSIIILTVKYQIYLYILLILDPQILQQAEDRVHRIGQKNAVVIHYLVARKTSDDKMWPMIEAKLSVLGGMGVGSGDYKDTENSNYKYTAEVGLLELPSVAVV